MAYPSCAPETAECSKKWSQYSDPLVKAGFEFLTTNGNPQRVCSEFDWVRAMDAQRKDKNMFLNPHLDEQLQITVQSIERLTAAINNLSREQKKFKKHRCCPCNAPLLTDVPAESYIALHYAGEDFYRCVDEILVEDPDPRLILSGIKPMMSRLSPLLDQLLLN